MKKLVKVEEVDGEGLEGLLGEKVVLFCMNYFYAGVLEGVNKEYVKLTDAGIVYDTGAWSDKDWSDFQKVGFDLYVQKSAIESFGKGK